MTFLCTIRLTAKIHRFLYINFLVRIDDECVIISRGRHSLNICRLSAGMREWYAGSRRRHRGMSLRLNYDRQACRVAIERPIARRSSLRCMTLYAPRDPSYGGAMVGRLERELKHLLLQGGLVEIECIFMVVVVADLIWQLQPTWHDDPQSRSL